MKFYVITLEGTPTNWLSYGASKMEAIERVFNTPISSGCIPRATATELHLDRSQTRLLVGALELGGKRMLEEIWVLVREMSLAAMREKVNLCWMGHNGI